MLAYWNFLKIAFRDLPQRFVVSRYRKEVFPPKSRRTSVRYGTVSLLKLLLKFLSKSQVRFRGSQIPWAKKSKIINYKDEVNGTEILLLEQVYRNFNGRFLSNYRILTGFITLSFSCFRILFSRLCYPFWRLDCVTFMRANLYSWR